MRTPAVSSLLVLAAASPALMGQPTVPETPRGQLLYDTHCIRCHAARIHWRDARAARDWKTLRAEVDRWQRQSGQQWPDEDVDAVARYLNETIYHYPQPQLRG